jgi:hypothetical protein
VASSSESERPERPGRDEETERARLYLLEYLRDEFRRYPEVRLRILPAAAIPSAESRDGVTAKTESREYFFETRWMQGKRFSEISKLVRAIKDVLPDRGEI